MQDINNLVTKALDKERTTSSTPLQKSQEKALDLATQNSTPIEWVTTLFAALMGIYGNIWTRNLPTEEEKLLIVIQMWQSALCGYTSEEIQGAVQFYNSPANLLRDRAPSSFEFADTCRMIRKKMEAPFVKVEFTKSSEHMYLEHQAKMAQIPNHGWKYSKTLAKNFPDDFAKVIEMVRAKNPECATTMEKFL